MMETITIHAMFIKPILKDIAIDKLHSSPYQPRDIFSEEALVSLAKTIEQLGILEPIIVRLSPRNHGHYEIIAGERRFRAAKLAGLHNIPCLLSNYNNEQTAQIAVIENTCREALNPIAQAHAMQRLGDEFQYTHDEIAILLGISRSKVSNLLRLLTLDARMQHWMKQGELSLSHGKILAGLPDDDQYWFAYEAIKKEWSVSMLDDSIKIITEKRKTSGKLTSQQTQKSSVLTNPLETKVSSQFGHSIKVTLNKNDSGSFRIPFQNKEAMCAILKKLGCGDETSV